MTRRVNISLSKYRCMRTKTLAANVIAIAALIITMSTLTSTGERSINVQMTGDHHDGSWVGNMTSGLQQHEQNMINNGTINLEQIIFEAIHSKINTSLTQTITNAEQSVGNNSFALAA